jgi:hypothetical protein
MLIIFFEINWFVHKDKTERPHLDTIEVMGAESHSMLNTLTEHNFQDAVKNSGSAGYGAYARKGITSNVMVANRPKVSFLPDGSNSPGNYGRLFVFLQCISK